MEVGHHLADLQTADESLLSELPVQLVELGMHALNRLEDPVGVLANRGLAVCVVLVIACHVVQGLALVSKSRAAGGTRLARCAT